MKGMKSAQEYVQAAPPGRYPSRIVQAEAGVSKKGDSMLHLTVEIIAPPQFAGQQADDYIGTDGTTKWGGMSKGRLRGLLGAAAVDTDNETPDSVIAGQLLNAVYEVEYGNEPRMTRTVADGPYDKEMTAVAPNGQTIVLQKLIVKNYHPLAQQQTVAPQQQFVQQQAPQQFVQQAAPAAPQFAPQQQLAPQGQQFAQAPFQQPVNAPAPQGFAVHAAPQFPPQGQLPPQQGGFVAPTGGAPLPWQQAPANGAAPAAAAPAQAQGRRLKIEDVPTQQG